MASDNNEKDLIKEAMLAGSDAIFDALLQRRISDGMARDAALADVLRASVAAHYAERGRAMDHMNHFLAGSGADILISLNTLMDEDAGIKSRMTGELLRRANDIHTVYDNAVKNRMSMVGPTISDVITLFQRNFANRDWCGALGTFPVSWEIINCPSRATSPIVVRTSGHNVYRWHPDDPRLTRRLHQFAQELVEKGKAKEFKMVAKDQVFYVDQINQKLIRDSFLKQTNPNNKKASDYFTGDQMNLVKDALEYKFFTAPTNKITNVIKAFFE